MPCKSIATLVFCFLAAVAAAEEVVFHGRPGEIPAQNAINTDVATDGAGRWVAVWTAPPEVTPGVRPILNIFAATSFDEGHNWSNAVTITTGAAANAGPPALVFTRSGWVVVWSQPSTSGTGATVVASHSNDGGFTWAAPVVIAEAKDGTHTHPALATAANGATVVVWQSSETLGRILGADFDILYARSTDNGQTWTAPAPLHDNANVDSGVDRRPTVAADGAGNCLAAWDSSESFGEPARDTDILFSVSRDNGATWSQVGVLNSNAPRDEVDAFVSVAAGGQGAWVAVWELTSASAGTRVAYAWTDDGGRMWSHAQRIALTSSAGPETSPRVVSDRQGRYLAAWTHNGEIAYAHSSDVRAGWSQPKPLVVNEGVTTKGAHVAKALDNPAPLLGADTHGRWLVLWQDGSTKEAGLKVAVGETIAMLPTGGGSVVLSAVLLLGTACVAAYARRRRYAD